MEHAEARFHTFSNMVLIILGHAIAALNISAGVIITKHHPPPKQMEHSVQAIAPSSHTHKDEKLKPVGHKSSTTPHLPTIYFRISLGQDKNKWGK